MGTTAKGAPYPDAGDPPDGPAQIEALADWVDARPGIAILTYAQISALAGVELWTGRVVHQTNTGADRPVAGPYTYNGVNWRLPWNMPWGLIGTATNTAGQTALGAGPVDITGVTLTKTYVANRYIRATLYGRLDPTGNGTLNAWIHDGSASLLAWSGVRQIGELEVFTGSRLWTPSAGSVTVKAQAGGTGGAGGANAAWSATNPWRLTVEDLGPNGTPA